MVALVGSSVIVWSDLVQGRNPLPLMALGFGTALVWAIWGTWKRRRTDEVWLAVNHLEYLLSVQGAAEALTTWSVARGLERYKAQKVVVGEAGLGLEVNGEVHWLRERGVRVVVCCTAGGYVRDCTFIGSNEHRVTVFAAGRLVRVAELGLQGG